MVSKISLSYKKLEENFVAMGREVTDQNKRDTEILMGALRLIQDNGGEMRYADIKAELPNIFQFNERELKPTKTWNHLWEAILGMVGGIELKAAGLIDTKKGIWMITSEGEKALNLSPEEFYKLFHFHWLEIQKQKKKQSTITDSPIEDTVELEAQSDINSLTASARDTIRQYIIRKDPYQFQNLIAALLRGMGYYTPFIAPKGKDGGIDIIAFEDPLGAKGNHLKVQVKHYPENPVSIDVISKIGYSVTKPNERAIVATSGRFTSECYAESRRSARAIRLLDMEEIIDLWIQYYPNMSEEDKAELPIIPIHYLNTEKI